jgi:hypothetical protein
MASKQWYCTFIQIEPSGGYTAKIIELCRLFFHQRFPDLACNKTLEASEDKAIQQELMAWIKPPSEAQSEAQSDSNADSETCLYAEFCLRCYISHPILYTCIDIYTKFGKAHGFVLDEILGIVLNDVQLSKTLLNTPQSDTHQPLATDILRTFNPEAGNLSAWTKMLTRQNKELNDFLLKRGVLRQSSWALLNEPKLEELRNILTETFNLPLFEVERACILLKSYHDVYRRDRRNPKNSKSNHGQCKLPTPKQLNEIQQKSGLPLSPEGVMTALITIADYLRQYRLLRKGVVPSVPFEDPGNQHAANQALLLEHDLEQEEGDRSSLPCKRLWDLLIPCLDQAIAAAIQHRHTYLQKRVPKNADKYIPALKFYFCDQNSMEEVADKVGLQAQWQVTRLLKIDDFLAHIRRNLFTQLKGNVLAQLQGEDCHSHCLCVTRLQNLEEEHLIPLIDKPRSNSSTNSLFLQRLCYVIQQFYSAD